MKPIVGAGWTIGVLVLFYLLIPILIKFIRKLSVSLIVFVISFFIATYYQYYIYVELGIGWFDSYTSIITQFPFLMMGIVSYFIIKKFLIHQELLEKRRTKIIGVALILFGIFLISYMFTQFKPTNLLFSENIFTFSLYYIDGIAFSCILMGFILYPWKGLVNRISKFIGNRSYGIYLLHPLILFTQNPRVYRFIYDYISDVNLAFFLSLIFTLSVVFILSTLTYYFIEKPAIKYIPKFILEKILKQQSNQKGKILKNT